jgi:hypothetical protein
MEIIILKNTIELDFQNIISNKVKCDDYVNQISELIEKINIKYNALIRNIKDNKNVEIPIYLGIDSLNFQNKLYILKFENIKKFYMRVFNRIYGDYYKMHKHIKNYIISNTTIPVINVIFTQYKDLDIDKCYQFDEIIKIQNTINQYIQSLYDIITKKNITIKPFINSDNAGYAVKYYISEENTNISIYTNKCLLFINYLTSFNTYHNNYLLDFLLQCRFLITSIKKDIDFNIDSELINLDNFLENNNIIDIDISNVHLNYIKRNNSESNLTSENLSTNISSDISSDISNSMFIYINNNNNNESEINIDNKRETNNDNESEINIDNKRETNNDNDKINYCNPQGLTLKINELSENKNKLFFCNIL